VAAPFRSGQGGQSPGRVWSLEQQSCREELGRERLARKFRLQAHVRNRRRPELELVPPDYSERATEVSVPYNGTTRAVLIRQNASTTDLTLPGYPVRSRMNRNPMAPDGEKIAVHSLSEIHRAAVKFHL